MKYNLVPSKNQRQEQEYSSYCLGFRARDLALWIELREEKIIHLDECYRMIAHSVAAQEQSATRGPLYVS